MINFKQAYHRRQRGAFFFLDLERGQKLK